MTELFTVLRREIVYIWYYFEIQFRQICRYWIIGMLIETNKNGKKVFRLEF